MVNTQRSSVTSICVEIDALPLKLVAMLRVFTTPVYTIETDGMIWTPQERRHDCSDKTKTNMKCWHGGGRGQRQGEMVLIPLMAFEL